MLLKLNALTRVVFSLCILLQSKAALAADAGYGGVKCLTATEVARVKARCNKEYEDETVVFDGDTSACKAASYWYDNPGDLRRAECDLASIRRDIESSLALVLKAATRYDAAPTFSSGQMEVRPSVVSAQSVWVKYSEKHCADDVGPHPGAGLGWSIRHTQCLLDEAVKRVSYLRSHWLFNNERELGRRAVNGEDNFVRVLETPSLNVRIVERCKRSEFGCGVVDYFGLDKKTKKMTKLTGRLGETSCRHRMGVCGLDAYEFLDGELVHRIYLSGRLEIFRGEDLQWSEDGVWNERKVDGRSRLD